MVMIVSRKDVEKVKSMIPEPVYEIGEVIEKMNERVVMKHLEVWD